MLNLGNLKVAVVLKQQSETNGGTLTSDNIDCLGADYMKILVHGTTSNNATNNPSVLKVQEADTTDDSNFADVTAFVGDGASGFTIPNSPTATTTKPFAIIDVDTRARKRYLRVKISPVTTQTYSVLALAGRQEQAPVGATGENAAVVVRG